MTCKCDEGLKEVIRALFNRPTEEIVYMLLQLLSFSVLIACLTDNRWMSGDTGNQGLWQHCFQNGTSKCCAPIYDIYGRQGFVDATRAFLFIEVILFLVVFFLTILGIYTISGLLYIAIGLMTFLAITVYGARHRHQR